MKEPRLKTILHCGRVKGWSLFSEVFATVTTGRVQSFLQAKPNTIPDPRPPASQQYTIESEGTPQTTNEIGDFKIDRGPRII